MAPLRNGVDIGPIPELSETKHSGLPSRLADIGKASKARLYSNKTVSTSHQRNQEVPVLPPDITRDTFNTAIADLRAQVGHENVEVNDKPLEDGWYMEHP
jgi:hypothetical protein